MSVTGEAVSEVRLSGERKRSNKSDIGEGETKVCIFHPPRVKSVI